MKYKPYTIFPFQNVQYSNSSASHVTVGSNHSFASKSVTDFVADTEGQILVKATEFATQTFLFGNQMRCLTDRISILGYELKIFSVPYLLLMPFSFCKFFVTF
jgi:hypothetical protein